MLSQKFTKTLIMGSIIVSSCLLTLLMLALLVVISTAWDLNHDFEPKTNSSQKNFESRFTRYENIFNDDNNASLYVGNPFSRRSGDVKDEPKPANETTGRALDLEALFGESSLDHQTGDRESRIVNEKPKINIQGFIPIITMDKTQRGHMQNQQQPQPVYSPSSSQDSFETQPVFSQNNPSYGYAGPEHGKQAFGGIGAALQNLAVFRPLKRKFGSSGYPQEQLTPGVDCLCVPFYMCKRGFLETSTAKNSFGNPNLNQQQPSEEFIRQQFAAAQTEAASNFASASLSSSYNQDSSPGSSLPQPSSSQPGASYDMNIPVDERSIDSERNINFPNNDTQEVS